MVKQPDEMLFTAQATAAERWVGEFNGQELANTTWSFAMLNSRTRSSLRHRRRWRSGE